MGRRNNIAVIICAIVAFSLVFFIAIRLVEADWTIEYLCDVLPENANPAWYLAEGDTGYRSTDGDILTLWTDDSQVAPEVQYQLLDVVDRDQGVMVEVRMKIGYIGNDGPYADTALGIYDSVEGFSLLFLEDRVFDQQNPSNYYLMNTKDSFHIYRIEYKNGEAKLYIDGGYRMQLTGFPYYVNRVLFGDQRIQPQGMNGESYWDYVKIETYSSLPSVPEFPAGLVFPVAFMPVIVYLLLRRKQRPVQ